MWHREEAEGCGPGWRYTPQMDSNMEKLNFKLAEANVKFRHQNAELVGANFKLHNQNAQLRRWNNHLGSIVAFQKQRIKSIQAGLEDVRTERDNLLAAGRHFDSIFHRGMVCTVPPAPHTEFVPRPPTTTFNMSFPNSGGGVDRTVSGIWLDGFLSPLTNCHPTTRSPFADNTPKQKEELRRYLLMQRSPADARTGGRGKAPLETSSAAIPGSLLKANALSASRESESRYSDPPQEACVPSGTGSPVWAQKAEADLMCHEERLFMPSTETSGECTRAPYEENIDGGPSASLPEENVGPDLPGETLPMSSIEPSEKLSKPRAGSVNDNTIGSLGEEQVRRCPFMSGNLGEEPSKQGDHMGGAAGPGGKIDYDRPQGARTATNESGPTKHERKTQRIDSRENPPRVSSLDVACRSERNTEEKPEASFPQRLSAQISGDEASIPDNSNSKPDPQNEELIASSGSAPDPPKIDDTTDFADPRRPDVIASRTPRSTEENASKHVQGKHNGSATPASSAWSSRYSPKPDSVNPANDSDSGGSKGKGRQNRVDPVDGGDETSVDDGISSNRYTHVTHCCWCFNERLESQAVALCEGCPRIICRQCMLKVGLRVPSGDNSRDSILPASSCRCLKFDSQFRKPPPTAQPVAHLIEELRRHDLSLQFREPVDTESNPNYLSVITKEKMMDLATMAERMKNRCYQTPRGQRKFLLDLRLIWSNCWEYAQYDPEDQAPIPGIVSCTLILANMVDEYCKSNIKVSALNLDEKSWLAARESLKQTKFCEMVKGNPHNISPAMNAKQRSAEEHQMDNDLTKRILPSSSGSTSVKRAFFSLSSPEDNSSDPEEVVSRTLCILADVGNRLVQEAKRRRETRNFC